MNAQADSYVHILMSFGEKNAQLLTKLYALKASLLSQPFSPHLSDVNLAKIRFTVDRKFPVLVDLSQVKEKYIVVCWHGTVCIF